MDSGSLLFLGITAFAIVSVVAFWQALMYRERCRASGLTRQERRLYRQMSKQRWEAFSYTIPLRNVIGGDEQEAQV